MKFPKHFQDRMVQRGINLDHVKAAIKHPDKKVNAYEGKIRVSKKIDGKTIEVIYCREGFRDKSNQYIIITAYYI